MATLVELSTDQLMGDCKRTSIAEFPAYISVLLAHNGCFSWGLKRATAKTNHKLVCYDIPFFCIFYSTFVLGIQFPGGGFKYFSFSTLFRGRLPI